MTRRADWTPFSELVNVQKRLNDLFESALARSNFETPEGIDSWTPVCDAFANGQQMVVCLELPGVDQSQIDVRVESDDLVVEGNLEMEREEDGTRFHRVERSYGRFSRRFHLPSTVDRGAIEAAFRDGVLRVVMPMHGSADPGPVQVSIS